MAMTRCPKCDRWIFDWGKPHSCPAAWRVREDYPECGDEEARTIYAADEETAAIEFGEWYDAGDYDLLNGDSLKVVVTPLDRQDDEVRFTVTGESVPQYSAVEQDA